MGGIRVCRSERPARARAQEEAISHLIAEATVSNGPARLFVRAVGAGSTVVVLHGGPDFDHRYLLPELDLLAAHARLVYYDQRGRGQSFTGEGPGDVTVSSEVADVDRVREWARQPSIALLGHSWGGLLAMEYAIRHPDRVSHLILMNTAPASHADALVMRAALTASRSPEQRARMAALRADPAYRMGNIDTDLAYYRIHFANALSQREDVERVVGRLRATFTPEKVVAARAIEDSLYDQTWSREDFDLFPQLERLRVPTLVIHGDHDLIPLELARHIATAIPDARLEIVAECGHFAYLEQPEVVRLAIVRLMSAA